MKPKLTIAIPCYNSEKTIAASIESALAQDFKQKEILVIDDGSTDGTVDIVNRYDVRLVVNPKNMGIGWNIEALMKKAKGDVVVYLCSDDLFADSLVCWDIYNIFQDNPKIGIIGRTYFEFMEGVSRPVGVFRDKNILTGSCNPSGMAFRKDNRAESTNDIFVEMPTMVAWYLRQGWDWTMLGYDSIAVRIHRNNTGVKESYYNGSMYQNWYDLLGEPLDFPQGLLQIKARASKNLKEEICVMLKTDPSKKRNLLSWFYILTATIMPSRLLQSLSRFYRMRISSLFVKARRRCNGN